MIARTRHAAAESLLAMLMLMVWDGLLIIGEGLGLEGRRARRFADIAWIGFAVLVALWLTAMAAVTPEVLW